MVHTVVFVKLCWRNESLFVCAIAYTRFCIRYWGKMQTDICFIYQNNFLILGASYNMHQIELAVPAKLVRQS